MTTMLETIAPLEKEPKGMITLRASYMVVPNASRRSPRVVRSRSVVPRKCWGTRMCVNVTIEDIERAEVADPTGDVVQLPEEGEG